MPANKNAVIRYKFLDELLSDYHHLYTMDELTDRVNDRLESLGYYPVVKRSLEKDLVFLQERPFCIPIERIRVEGKSCIRYAVRGFSIFHHELTKEEKSLLGEVLNTVGQFKGLPNFEWLDGLRENLGLKQPREVLSFFHNPLLKNSNMLASLYECVANGQVLKVEYKRFRNFSSEVYEIHPYLLKQYNNRWYLVGLRPGEWKIYTLPIDRIREVEPLPEVEFIPYEGDINDYFKDTIGITVYDEAKVEKIICWADDVTLNYVLTKPFHESQKLITDEEDELRHRYAVPEGGSFLQLNCTLNIELEQALTRHFGGLLILEPEKLRIQVAERIKNMSIRYESLKNLD